MPSRQGSLTADGDYTISFTASTLAITPATLDIAAEPETKVYGSADPALAYTVSGLAFSDKAASVLAGSLSRAPGETVSGGPYAISQRSLTANSNYTISFTASLLAITPATLDIAAEPETKVYGAADPALAYTVSGLAFTDTPAEVLSGSLSRAAGETVSGGPYAINRGSLAANSNYIISFTGNSLSITPAAPTIKVSDASGPYTGSPFAATVTITGCEWYGCLEPGRCRSDPGLLHRIGHLRYKDGFHASERLRDIYGRRQLRRHADYSAVQSAPVAFTIGQATPTIALSASVNSPVYGQSVTFVASVAGGVTPAGTVTFLDGGTPLGTAALNGSGQATLVVTTLSVGPTRSPPASVAQPTCLVCNRRRLPSQ